MADPQKKPASSTAETATKSEAGPASSGRPRLANHLAELQARADRYFDTDEDMPLRQHILLLTIVAFFACFIIWASVTKIDMLTRGEGKVVPSSEVQKISSLEGGIIDAFYVKEGDEVKQGEKLIRMRDIQATSDLGVNRQKYLALEAKVIRLQAVASGQSAPPVFPAEVSQGAPDVVRDELAAFRATEDNLQSQVSVLESQEVQKQEEAHELASKASDLRGEVALAKQQRDMIAPLVPKGSASQGELLTANRELSEKQTDLNSASDAAPRAQQAVREIQARISEAKSSVQAQAQTDLAAANAEENSIKASLSALVDRQARTELVSPADGVVQAIKVKTIGGVVPPGADVIEVVPTNAPLLIEARIKPADIAFIHPGQTAKVKVTAYDYSIYGGLDGQVVDISADTITDDKGQTFYRVRAQTKQTYLVHHGQKLQIIPGMVARLDILTGRRTVMEYILKPLIKTVDDAMRER